MKKKNLFDALTNIDDEYIKEAMEYKKENNKKPFIKYFALAASLVIIFSSIYILNKNTRDSNKLGNIINDRSNPHSFMKYEGPVFPLISLSNENEIKSIRDLTYDIEKNHEKGFIDTVKIKDKYLINTDGEKNAKLIYPISGRLIDVENIIPKIILNNKIYPGKLYIGDKIEKNDEDGEEALLTYKDFLEKLNQEYIEDAMKDKIYQNEKVYVYEISNAYKNDEDNDLAPNLALSYNLCKDKTKVYSYLMDGYNFDEENNREVRSFFIDDINGYNYGRKRYIFVLGNDIKNVQLKAYTDGSLKDEYMNGGGNIRRYESDLFSIIDMVSKDFKDNLIRENKTVFNNLGDKEVFTLLMKELNKEDNNTSDFNEDLYSLITEQRIFLLELDLKIDKEVELSFNYIKNPSMDFLGEMKNNLFYDFLTRIDNSINYEKEKISIINTNQVEFIEDNFEFDLNGEIDKRDLNLDKNYYSFMYKRND